MVSVDDDDDDTLYGKYILGISMSFQNFRLSLPARSNKISRYGTKVRVPLSEIPTH